jgi:hypothetical protein
MEHQLLYIMVQDASFTEFDNTKIQRGSQGKGFYLTDAPYFARNYGKNVIPYST